MFDVFYTGPKPNLFSFERPALDLADAQSQSRTKFCWFVNGLNDYTDFDFNFVPVPWEAEHTHVWASQWQDNGGTYFVPKHTTEHQWHWHTEKQDIVIRSQATDIFYMDFMNIGSQVDLSLLEESWPNIKSTRYVDSHLNVFKRIINLATTEYVWIISSLCDYAAFDFTWHPAQWTEEMVHVFPSGNQKRGDTFYIHVASFKRQMAELELLDWFNVINYCDRMRVERHSMPRCDYNSDNLVDEIKKFEFTGPYTLFTNQSDLTVYYQPCLWSEKDRSIETFTRSHAVCVVPRDVKAHLQSQVYDYPYVKSQEQQHFTEKELDIIYISNGEPDEQKWFENTEYQSNRDVRWIRGVNGRANAYKAAAEASTTPWFFAVFAKLEVLGGSFPWHWQPDYFQEPKHYIFHARNPVNGLVYGHQAMIAYNKRLVLETVDSGLDFTLSKAHEVVPILSGIAHFNQSAWMTWRTAFREVVKLKHFSVTQPNVETEYRLKTWLTKAQGDYAEWCLRGAADAVEYYESVNGDYDALMLTFEWAWLQEYFKRYKQ
jgi:hypothetical protein